MEQFLSRFTIAKMKQGDWREVEHIYAEGIAALAAAFENGATRCCSRDVNVEAAHHFLLQKYQVAPVS
jgi:hypothetical protein